MTLPFAAGAFLVSSGFAFSFAFISLVFSYKDCDTKKEVGQKFLCVFSVAFLPMFWIITGLRMLFS